MGVVGKHPRMLGRIIDPWDVDDFLLNCKYGVLQYVVLKIICTFLTIIMELGGVYENGVFRVDRGYLYIAFIANFSQCWALYVLVKLYLAVKDDLTTPVNWRPIGKFMCVKGVVFATWWQGVFIAFLQSNGIIHSRGSWAADDVADGLQDYLICVEMLFFALAHSYTFSYKEYLTLQGDGVDEGRAGLDSYNFMKEDFKNVGSFRSAFWNSSFPSEITRDIKEEVFAKSSKKKKKKGGSEEHTPSTPSKEPSSSSASTPSSPTSPISTASKAGSVVKEVVSEQERLKSEIEDLVPLKITLDGNVMSVGEGGKWEIMETEAVEGRRKIMELEGIIEGKDKEISSLSLATTSTTSTTNAMAFKLEVLLDMLSISRADVTKTERMLEKERIVSDEYRKELERVLKVCEDC
eukprot:CAMPEP_0118668606 /NCGR_PEP_ID=MMETSP0785-20121206/20437_1 /TAXON_ID=91992 /ORGANISM="Bolidomonas pacifica, Strain CCMP 1866" /LENGTH=406 /DNA_ID=CAMNT_0006563193 /DNA_START=555 /DNA_END=1778 /DNA_ORIENTATION=+